MTFLRVGFTGLLLFFWPGTGFSQTHMIIYDGVTGIHDVYLINDSAVVSTLIPKSPADQAGIKPGDLIIAIDDSVVSGAGMNKREIRQLLHDRSGKRIELKIKREGEDKLLSFSFQRDPYLYQIDSYDYLYLVDSLDQWNINDIMSNAPDSLFKDPLQAKITVHSVEMDSPAERNGILPGDQIISLADELQGEYSYHIRYDRLKQISPETSMTILREDSLISISLPESDLQAGLMGMKSQFEHDFSFPSVWLKVTTENRLAADRNYLFNIPELKGKDSLNFFYSSPSGDLVEKRSGILIPVNERDFIYKNWHAVKVPLYAGNQQTFFFRLNAEESLDGAHLQIYAEDTIITYDRYERMVLFGFLFTMLIISAFFLVLFGMLRARQYLYFALYIGSLVLFLFITDGYLDEYVWKENNFFLKFLEKFQPYIMSWISIFFLLFGIAYLELRKTIRNWFHAIVIVLTLTGLRIILVIIEVVFNVSYPGLIENMIRVVWIFTVGIIPLFILIPPAIIRIRNGFRPAWYFLAANVVLIPLIYVTLYSSLYSNTVITIYESMFIRLFFSSGMYIAAILQIVIFSFGIADKMKLDEMERKRIQEQIIEQLKENEKLKDKVNRELEEKVRERTREISEQKEEIESQRDKIESQRDMVITQKKQITDSIDYARRIQLAVLPRDQYLEQLMSEFFVFYRPKDIVSGDFYWIKEVEQSLIVVVADATGHGVPGAFMSMLGITLLNEQLAKSKLDAPGEILDHMRFKVKEMLVQRGNVEEQKDGMDMGIAIINKEQKRLHFAGAHHSLFLVRKISHRSGNQTEIEPSLTDNSHQLFELKGDRQPVGLHWEETSFTSHQFKMFDNDTLYLTTDGFIDQFGGEHRKKFKPHQFRELLLSFQQEPMDQQKQRLESAFERWCGDHEQIDDVCVIGFRMGRNS